jgi:hypothetical protein
MTKKTKSNIQQNVQAAKKGENFNGGSGDNTSGPSEGRATISAEQSNEYAG